MGTLKSSVLILFSALFCLTWGWEPGIQYVYNYVGRSATGIYKLKQQNAVIQIQSRVIVQSIDENTIAVKLSEGRLKRNGRYMENPYFVGKKNPFHEIEGEEDPIPNGEWLGEPFIISHNKGSITGVKIGAEEPLWIVNFKKGIASQLQLDITGVRRNGSEVDWTVPKDGESDTFNVFEDSLSGDCSTTIAISRIPWSQVYAQDTFELGSFDEVCKGKPVYKIVKTKDFNRCQNNPIWHSTTSNIQSCDFSKANCGDFMKRTSIYKYVACGDNYPRVTVVQANGFSDLHAQPFATKSDELMNAVVTQWTLEKKERVNDQFSSMPLFKEHNSLSYVFGDFKQWDQDETHAPPTLSDAYLKSPVSVLTLHNHVLDALRAVVRDLKERPDSEKDNLERLAFVCRVLPMFSLGELRILWQDVKSQDNATVTLFIDSVVQAGSNPAVMLIKELVESDQITGTEAIWAVGAIGHYAKTPTRELLQELVNLMKSGPVQSSKEMKQTLMVMVADLLHTVCSSRISAAKRYPVSVMVDFCNAKDTIIIDEFLPLLKREFESSQDTADRIPVLAALGYLGVEEIIPILVSVIRGTPGKFDDTAERLRAIQSFHRIAYIVPEKVHPILIRLATNVAERPEIRMSSLGLSILSNGPLATWQKLAASTWFEPSQQVASWTHSLIHSLIKIPKAANPALFELSQKARVVWPLVKSAPFGLPYSFVYSGTSHLDEGISATLHNINMRNSDAQTWPVYTAHRYFYQIGRLNRVPINAFFWNYNMAEVWQNTFNKLYNRIIPMAHKPGNNTEMLKGIWDDLNITPRPADKRAGLLHINLFESINRFINLEKMEELVPQFFTNIMKYQDKPHEVSITKYRMLGEYNVHFPTDLGLPMRYMYTLPMIASMQGTLRGDRQIGITSNIATELSWKLCAELRVDVPFNGNYIAAGVDVLVDSNFPKELNFNYEAPGQIKVTWTPGSKITDLLYYHVKPYTVTRNRADTIKPTLEDPAAHLISVTDKPIQREFPLGDRFGVNMRLIEQSELAHSDKWSWWQWLTKWEMTSYSNFDLSIPTELRSRKYVLRYEPSGTRARSVSTFFQYQHAEKSSEDTIVYNSGTDRPRTPSESDVSYNSIATEFRPALSRLFNNIASGNAHLLRAGFTSEWKDGTWVHFNATMGLAKDTTYTKDFTDIQIEKYSSAGANIHANRDTSYAICYWAVRNWNNPPTYGFSKDVLHLTEEDTIGFGQQCDQSKIVLKAKVYRDETAAKAAMYSPAGEQCQKDMAAGFMYGSPACTKARRMDQTYNNYELTAEAENLPEPVLLWTNRFRQWINHILYPFTMKHTQGQSNNPNRASWIIKRDPWTGASNMTFIRPMETLVASNVRSETNIWARFSPLTWAYAQVFYPLNAGSNIFRDAVNLTTGAVSESRCYVGPDAVHTFDGAFYNYTIGECPHVLLTDSHKKSNIAVIAHEGRNGHKIVTVINDKDTVEMDPSGFITVNGAKTAYKTMSQESRIEIRDNETTKAVIYRLTGEGVIMDIKGWNFYVKVQGSQIELSAPMYLRGRTCGMCGDFNQETEGEWKTPDRCAVSSGELMASSFMLKTGKGCSADKNEVSRRLKKIVPCQSIDQWYHTPLPDY